VVLCSMLRPFPTARQVVTSTPPCIALTSLHRVRRAVTAHSNDDNRPAVQESLSANTSSTGLSDGQLAVWSVAGSFAAGGLLGLLGPYDAALPADVQQLSASLGWAYFSAWTVSFYPQVRTGFSSSALHAMLPSNTPCPAGLATPCHSCAVGPSQQAPHCCSHQLASNPCPYSPHAHLHLSCLHR
jgi:hypothetical protein